MTEFLLQAGGGESMDIISLIRGASPVVMGVMILLGVMSLATWFVIGSKALYLLRGTSRSAAFLDAFWRAKMLEDVWKTTESAPPSPVSELFRAGYLELEKLKARRAHQTTAPDGENEMGDMESLERALARARTVQMTEMESRLPLLGTTASAAPFIGLFGTVVGIMNSFRNIGAKGAANLATVAPGIAEALVATAIGLVAAIPAVMAYNYFARQIRVITADMETFASDFLNIVRRRFL